MESKMICSEPTIKTQDCLFVETIEHKLVKRANRFVKHVTYIESMTWAQPLPPKNHIHSVTMVLGLPAFDLLSLDPGLACYGSSNRWLLCVATSSHHTLQRWKRIAQQQRIPTKICFDKAGLDNIVKAPPWSHKHSVLLKGDESVDCCDTWVDGWTFTLVSFGQRTRPLGCISNLQGVTGHCSKLYRSKFHCHMIIMFNSTHSPMSDGSSKINNLGHQISLGNMILCHKNRHQLLLIVS